MVLPVPRVLLLIVLLTVLAAPIAAEEPVAVGRIALQPAPSATPSHDELWRLLQSQQREIEALKRRLGQPTDPAEEISPAGTKDAVQQTGPAGNDADAPAKPKQQADEKPSATTGYNKSWFIASPAGIEFKPDDSPFLLQINSRLQLRHTAFDSEGPTADENDFEFERIRLVFSGHAYTPDLKYFIQIDGDSDQQEFLDWLDYFVKYDIGHHLWDGEQGGLGIIFGKWKLPFNRTRAESGFKLQFTDRAMASALFDINRSVGVGLYGKAYLLPEPIQWELAVFNGFQTQGARPVRVGELDRNIATSGRAFFDLVGEWGVDGEPDLTPHECPAIRIGGGFAYSRVDIEGMREFNSFRVIDSGARLSSLLPPSVTAYNAFLYAVDANFKWRGISVLSEYYFRHFNQFAGANVPDLFDHGMLLQAGCFVVSEKLELVSRWSRAVGDSGTLGLRNQSADEVGGAIVWYIRGHSIKLTFDVSHVNGSPTQDPALNLRAGDDGMLYRTQFQLTF